MDSFKNNIQNTIFSNKTQFIKNRRGYNNSNSSSNPSIFGEYTTYLLWILLFIIVIIICYLTVMTAKYLSTNCPNKKSWFKYIIKFCYNDVCNPVQPVINNSRLYI